MTAIPDHADHELPMPPPRRRGKANQLRKLWVDMRDGDSIQLEDIKDVYSLIALAHREHWRYEMRRTDADGARKWRIWKRWENEPYAQKDRREIKITRADSAGADRGPGRRSVPVRGIGAVEVSG